MKPEAKKFDEQSLSTMKAWVESDETKSAIDAITKANDEDAGTFEVVINTETWTATAR